MLLPLILATFLMICSSSSNACSTASNVFASVASGVTGLVDDVVEDVDDIVIAHQGAPIGLGVQFEKLLGLDARRLVTSEPLEISLRFAVPVALRPSTDPIRCWRRSTSTFLPGNNDAIPSWV